MQHALEEDLTWAMAVDSKSARQERKALEEVERILASVMDLAEHVGNLYGSNRQ